MNILPPSSRSTLLCYVDLRRRRACSGRAGSIDGTRMRLRVALGGSGVAMAKDRSIVVVPGRNTERIVRGVSGTDGGERQGENGENGERRELEGA